MKITKYRMDQLEEARIIQKDCIKHHLPCPPVAWWRAEILDENGKVEEQIDSKCNSYTRNGLNLIAQHSMYLTSSIASSGYFGDGTLSYKNIEGVVIGLAGIGYSDGTTIIFGNGLAPEHLNAHILSNDITSSFSSSSTQTTTTFDSTTRKLQTSIQRTLTNNTEQPITLTEAGIRVKVQILGGGSLTANRSTLVVRDVFEVPIEIPAGKSLAFTYNFELLYPE
jgi:hypothetical protein